MPVFVACPFCDWHIQDADAFAAFSLLDLHELLVHPALRTLKE